jgi:endonuclease YncB( thermonuclease family)
VLTPRLLQRGALALCLFLLLLAAPASAADLLEGRVVRIADGDTLTVLDGDQIQHRVRLAGIDAPERGQPFGARAKQNLARLTFGNPVEIRWHKPDRYGRLVGQVWVDVSAGWCGSMSG